MAVNRRRVVVAINPFARFGARSLVGPAVVGALRSLGYEVSSLVEPDFGALEETVRSALATEPDALVVVGGDGMVSLAVNALVGSSIPLGIVASGTGNDMARALGLPIDDPDAAIATLTDALARPARVIDAVHVRDGRGVETWYAGVLSAGFDARVNERANLMRHPRGKSRYTIAMVRELLALSPTSYRIELDGVEVVTDGLLVAVANGVSIGGGMRLTPDALVDDGLLDVLVVQPMSRVAFLRIFPRVFRGTHVGDPRVSIRRARTVRIEADGVVAYADGERVGSLPVDIRIEPGALAVLLPR